MLSGQNLGDDLFDRLVAMFGDAVREGGGYKRVVMFYPELEEKLHSARRAFDSATSENIIELAQEYLALLEEYLVQLYDHPGRYVQPASPSSAAAASSMRQAIQRTIEQTEQERNRIEAFVDSIEDLTYGEAVETLNKYKYNGRDTWKLRLMEVTDGTDNTINIEEAGEIARRLRCEAYIAQREGVAG